jgi:very-short-patch-repair endonuclease
MIAMTSERGYRSDAERDFERMLEGYGLIEGIHYVREQRFQRAFYDRDAQPFKIRVDFWFPRWRVVVEVKAGPLGRKHDVKCDARAEAERLRDQGAPGWKVSRVDWSNQLEKFLCIGEQAHEERETNGILWILADDGQMNGAEAVRRKYSRQNRRHHQVHEMRRQLRRGHGFNPMGLAEAARLLLRFRQVDELEPESVYDAEWLRSLPMMTQVYYRMQVENTKLLLLNTVHEFDTLEPVIVDPEVADIDGDEVTIKGGYVLLPACA